MTDERRWSLSDEPETRTAGRGYPPGWPLGVLCSTPARVTPGPEVIPPVPEPMVRARPIMLADMPTGARNIANAAISAGFHLKNTYAKGPRLDKDDRVIEISESVLIRGAHLDGRRVIACWGTKTAIKGKNAGQVSWGFDFGYVTTPYITPINSSGLRSYMLPVSTTTKPGDPQ